jgi:hypothetical protein
VISWVELIINNCMGTWGHNCRLEAGRHLTFYSLTKSRIPPGNSVQCEFTEPLRVRIWAGGGGVVWGGGGEGTGGKGDWDRYST